MKKLVLLAILVAWSLLGITLARFEWMKTHHQQPDFVTRPYSESRSCRQCHQQVYDDWQRSPHAKALTSTFPRMMDPGDKEASCLPCHTPQPVLETGLELPPLARDDRREEGVSCITCHQTKEGMASSQAGLRGACRPVQDARLAQPELCQSCHNAHGTVDQWRASAFAARGQDCRSCHLPHGEHLMLGAHDHQALAAAVSLELSHSGQIEVKVSNVAAGHNLPSGRRSRSLVLVVRFVDAAGQKLAEQRYLYRNPFKGEPGENTQLQSGETRLHRYSIPPGAALVEASLLYQFRPSQPDSEGVLLQRRRLVIRQTPSES